MMSSNTTLGWIQVLIGLLCLIIGLKVQNNVMRKAMKLNTQRTKGWVVSKSQSHRLAVRGTGTMGRWEASRWMQIETKPQVSEDIEGHQNHCLMVPWSWNTWDVKMSKIGHIRCAVAWNGLLLLNRSSLGKDFPVPRVLPRVINNGPPWRCLSGGELGKGGVILDMWNIFVLVQERWQCNSALVSISRMFGNVMSTWLYLVFPLQ